MRGYVNNKNIKKDRYRERDREEMKTLRILSEKDVANSLPFIFPYFSQKDKRLCYILTRMMDEITLLFFEK